MSKETATELLKKVVRHPDCEKMNLSTVKGYLGELMIKEKLEAEGLSVKHVGNQSGYDLEFSISDAIKIKIDVKLSLPKDEFRWGFDYWGWALQHENKKKGITATHFVCMGCSTELETQAIFIVSAKDINKFPKGEKQFSKVIHGLVLPLPDQNIKHIDSQLLNGSKALLESKVITQLSPKDSLSEILKKMIVKS
jgi:hypothetical protein